MQSTSTLAKSALELLVSVDVAQNIDFKGHFRELEVEGLILRSDLNSDRISAG
ncbi:hypothetical protein I8751_13055 [Nostocaceae cyanobacterium CENA357]|uniref:Uncharacterized protein n=1 Tax=Atlanticothrix silvestris CENA357 TaxID=1725252 RepID=A0A8J7L2K4_9CYAN|nr:hypothetical protein [Atlanticothrix silvestris]MBH8553284.1 hypothetical protein [Atlanticothrix silvestris CENA357]